MERFTKKNFEDINTLLVEKRAQPVSERMHHLVWVLHLQVGPLMAEIDYLNERIVALEAELMGETESSPPTPPPDTL